MTEGGTVQLVRYNWPTGTTLVEAQVGKWETCVFEPIFIFSFRLHWMTRQSRGHQSWADWDVRIGFKLLKQKMKTIILQDWFQQRCETAHSTSKGDGCRGRSCKGGQSKGDLVQLRDGGRSRTMLNGETAFKLELILQMAFEPTLSLPPPSLNWLK